MAKVWKRKELSLDLLGFDEDDIEEVEQALTLLSQGVSERDLAVRLNGNSTGNSGTGRGTYSLTYLLTYTLAYSLTYLLTYSLTYSLTYALTYSLTYVGTVDGAASTYSSKVETFNMDTLNRKNTPVITESPTASNTAQSSWHALSTNTSAYTMSVDAYDPLHTQANGHNAVDSKQLSAYSQYKSFHDGWIECYTDEGVVYYYNSRTGESSWTLPEKSAASNGWNSLVTSSAVANPTQATGPTEGGTNMWGVVATSNPTQTTGPTEGGANMWGVVATTKSTEKPANMWESLVGAKTFPLADTPLVKPRTLPIPIFPDVAYYSKEQGLSRQLILLNTQDTWQKDLIQVLTHSPNLAHSPTHSLTHSFSVNSL